MLTSVQHEAAQPVSNGWATTALNSSAHPLGGWYCAQQHPSGITTYICLDFQQQAILSR